MTNNTKQKFDCKFRPEYIVMSHNLNSIKYLTFVHFFEIDWNNEIDICHKKFTNFRELVVCTGML